MTNWNPSSWQTSPLKLQMPVYNNIKKLTSIKKELANFNGLVDLDKILLLKEKFKNIVQNREFLIIGGNCAESLKYDNATVDTVGTIQEMAEIIFKKTGNEVIKIGRMAGQYAKPRSSEFETINGVSLPSYRGDIINNINFTEEGRKPNSELMLKAFHRSLETLSTIEKIDDNFYTTHEALLLDYEESLVRRENNTTYLSSTYFPWIGDRTRKYNSAHVEFLRGVINPISIKCGTDTDLEDLIKIIKILNPKNEIGKIFLTLRMGSENIEKYFPILIKSILKNDLNVLWISDPMHGNSKKMNDKKTRYLSDIESEISKFFSICKNNNIYPAGVHFEIIGKNVTECIGLSVKENNLNQNYETLCDPRLNKEQSLYLIKKISELI